MTSKLTKSVYTDWAETCLIAFDSGAFDSGWSPTRSLAVRTTKRSKLGGRPTLYYKAGDDENGVRKYDLQFLSLRRCQERSTRTLLSRACRALLRVLSRSRG